MRAEAELAQQHPHKGIVQSVGVVEHERWPVQVIEHVDGLRLDTILLINGAMSTEGACRVGWQTAIALAELHHRQPVGFHGALAPDRVVVDVEGNARLRDVGRLLNAQAPSRLSPERRACEGGPTEADDIYALGLLVAEAALGQPLELDGGFLDVKVIEGLLPERLVDALAALLAPAETRIKNAAAAARIFLEAEYSFGDGSQALRSALERARFGLSADAETADGFDVHGPVTTPDGVLALHPADLDLEVTAPGLKVPGPAAPSAKKSGAGLVVGLFALGLFGLALPAAVAAAVVVAKVAPGRFALHMPSLTSLASPSPAGAPPTESPPSTALPSTALPSTSLPSTSLPSASLPPTHMPSLPSAHMPSLSSVHMPSLPSVHMPSLPSLPSVHMPSLPSLPSVHMPSLPSLPSVHMPSLHMPDLHLPSFSLPSFSLPSFSLPSLASIESRVRGAPGAEADAMGGDGVKLALADVADTKVVSDAAPSLLGTDAPAFVTTTSAKAEAPAHPAHAHPRSDAHARADVHPAHVAARPAHVAAHPRADVAAPHPAAHPVKLVINVDDGTRLRVQKKLAACGVTASTVGVIHVVVPAGAVRAHSDPHNGCVDRVLTRALYGAIANDDEPFEIVP